MRPVSAGSALLQHVHVELSSEQQALHQGSNQPQLTADLQQQGWHPKPQEAGIGRGGGPGASSLHAEGIYELLSGLEEGAQGEGEGGGGGAPGRVMALLQELGLVEDREAMDGAGGRGRVRDSLASDAGGGGGQGGDAGCRVGGASSVRNAAGVGAMLSPPRRSCTGADVSLSPGAKVGSSDSLGVGLGPVGKPAHLVESVYDGVRSKIRRLQEEVKEKEDTIGLLHKVRGGNRV